MTSALPRAATPVLLALAGLTVLAMWLQANASASLLPHAYCITAEPSLQWLHVVSDMAISFAYLSIPASLLYVVRRRRDIPFGWVGYLFGLFIVSCGATHLFEVWTLWTPVYWYSGMVKAVTAAASIATAYVLIRLTPHMLAIPTAAQLREANRALHAEVQSRRAAEEALREAKAKLEQRVASTTARAQEAAMILDRFFDEAPLGLGVLDASLRFERINTALARINGVPASQHGGRTLHEVLGSLPPQALGAIERVARTREPVHDLAIAMPDGTGGEQRFLVQYFPIEVPGEPVRVGGIVQDVTWQHRMEHERAQALAAAEEANQSKDRFLAKVSHELRSPLQVALSAAEGLRRSPALPHAAQRLLDRLTHSVHQQARMVSDLLDVSRILSGKLHMQLALVDPARPLLDALEHWQQQAAARDVRIDAQGLHPGLAEVEVDPARLEQMYTNLLDNAIRFSRAQGTVTLSCTVQAGRWQLCVRDEGPGLAPAELRSVFEPFVQAPNQPAGGKGLGLGLAIVRSLADAFGGRVRAESEGAGQGAMFCLELPLADAVQRARHARPAAVDGPARLDGWRLLYVEDEPEVAAAMQEGLAAAGAQVEVAHSHAAAMALLAQSHFDVLVSDLNLGDGPSGLDLMRDVRATPGIASMRAIAVSAFGGIEDRRATRRAGFTAHLVKPVSAEAVARAVRDALAPPGDQPAGMGES